MWIPHSKLFATYEEAYARFLKVSPSLDDEENKAEQYVNSNYVKDMGVKDMGVKDMDVKDMEKEYIIIESRQQIAGYPYEYCAKRPEGAVIARMDFLENTA